MSDTIGRIQSAAIHPSTLQLLGGPAVVVEARRSSFESTRGLVFKYRAVERLSTFLGATPPQLMRVIVSNDRTAQRRKEQGSLTVEESDRLARVARVTQRAVDAFGDVDQAREWLQRPNRALEGERPLELLGTDAGAELVTDELGRIEYGDLF